MASVRDVDKGFAAFVKGCEASNGLTIKVGIHSEAPGEVLEKAEANEYGTETIPARPFVSGWADENREAAVAEIKAVLARALKSGKDPTQALEVSALKFQGQMQQRIADGIDPPNAESTVARKGSSTPLIDTGELRSSVLGKVVR